MLRHNVVARVYYFMGEIGIMYRRTIWQNKNTNVINVGECLLFLSRRLDINAHLAADHYSEKGNPVLALLHRTGLNFIE